MNNLIYMSKYVYHKPPTAIGLTYLGKNVDHRYRQSSVKNLQRNKNRLCMYCNEPSKATSKKLLEICLLTRDNENSFATILPYSTL